MLAQDKFKSPGEFWMEIARERRRKEKNWMVRLDEKFLRPLFVRKEVRDQFTMEILRMDTEQMSINIDETKEDVECLSASVRRSVDIRRLSTSLHRRSVEAEVCVQLSAFSQNSCFCVPYVSWFGVSCCLSVAQWKSLRCRTLRNIESVWMSSVDPC